MHSSLNSGAQDNGSVVNVEPAVTTDNWMLPSLDNDSVNATNFSSVVDNVGYADPCVVPMWFHFVVNTLLIGALCVFGLFGNTLSLIVLERDCHNRVAVFLLQSLATADNLFLCVGFFQLSVFYGLLPQTFTGECSMKYATLTTTLITFTLTARKWVIEYHLQLFAQTWSTPTASNFRLQKQSAHTSVCFTKHIRILYSL